MIFSSAIFLSLFLPLVLALYFLAQEKLRNYVLLVASLIFYSWGEPRAVVIMLFLIIASYLVALGMVKYTKCAKIIFVYTDAITDSYHQFYKKLEMLLKNF